MKGKKAAITLSFAMLVLIAALVASKPLRPVNSSADAAAQEQVSDQREDEHEDHEEDLVSLTSEEMEEFGITIDTAAPGKLKSQLSLPGEIHVNADQTATVVPRLPGAVRDVKVTLGDRVRKGEVMAVIESRELADVRASFHAALQRVELAEAKYTREERLWKKKISSEEEYLDAKQALAEARIELESAKQKLLALGFSGQYLRDLPHDPSEPLTQYEITAPFDGTVVEKDITLGEVLKEDAVAFVVTDLTAVWVDLSVYQKDLPYINEGQQVVISAGHGIPDAKGEIAYVGPLVGEETRTALAPVILPNPTGLWRPGLFINGKVAIENIDVPILVPKTALQTFEGETVVFVKTDEGFRPKAVSIGRTNSRFAEIITGLPVGREYVAKGALVIKAELEKSAFGGHVH
jgi:cobalt-zinc-cadmium efflux system membrane fusion protein